jgi:hypothetical protein
MSRQPALILRPWRVADIPALAAEMSHEYLLGGMWWARRGERMARTVLPGGVERRAGPAGERDAARWLASQDRGWRDGDRLCFAVLAADDAGLADARRLFCGFARLLRPGATVAVEVSQLRQGDRTRPLVWQLGATLSEIFTLREDLVRVNTGGTEAGPGYDHSHVLAFDPPLAAP